MGPSQNGSSGNPEQPVEQRCEAELHIRLCARRLTTGHLQFGWRIEHVDNIDHVGDSLKGTWGPFTLPHEAGQDVAAAVRTWWKGVHDAAARRREPTDLELVGEQLTLRDFLSD